MKQTEAIKPGARRHWKLIWRWLFLVVVAVGVGLAASLVPVPYVIHGPGPTFNVLGKQGDMKILQVEGAKPDSDQGQLRMVTISERGGPGNPVSLANVIEALISPGYSVVSRDSVYPSGVTAQQVQQASSAQMQSSHSTAAVAALETLGYTLPTVITIEGAVEGSGAEGVLNQGDQLISITTPDGTVHRMDSASAPFALMRSQPVGTPLQITVKRDGKEITKTISSVADSQSAEEGEQQKGSKLGLFLSFDTKMPVKIDFNLEKVGGPSAGMIFALGIIDELSGDNLTNGKAIAGTGALSYDGQVEPIGGIAQKMYAAKRDGATWFLAPAENCGEVIGHIPDGLHVAAVSTLAQAVDTVKAIGGDDTEAITTCPEVLK